MADTVTEMRKVRKAYDSGVGARRGSTTDGHDPAPRRRPQRQVGPGRAAGRPLEARSRWSSPPRPGTPRWPSGQPPPGRAAGRLADHRGAPRAGGGPGRPGRRPGAARLPDPVGLQPAGAGPDRHERGRGAGPVGRGRGRYWAAPTWWSATRSVRDRARRPAGPPLPRPARPGQRHLVAAADRSLLLVAGRAVALVDPMDLLR